MSDVIPVTGSYSPLGQSCVLESPPCMHALPGTGHLIVLCWHWHLTGHGMCGGMNDLLCHSVPAVGLVYKGGFEMDCG